MVFDIDDGEALVIEVEIPRKVTACTANVSREDDVAHPMQRFGMMDEIAAATVWLCSDEIKLCDGSDIAGRGRLYGIMPYRDGTARNAI
jgi:hypothetical protein